MIYPTLHIAQDQSLTVNLLDTDYSTDENPIMSLADTGEGTEETFMTLLQCFVNQYNCGYEDGYYTGLEDGMEGETMEGEYDE